MTKHRLACLVLLVLAALCVAQSVWSLTHPGDQLGSGEDGVSGKLLFGVIIQLSTTGLLVATFLGAAIAMPRIADWALNIPHKEYWLAAERREQTLDYVVAWLLWFGSLNLVLILGIFRQAHLSQLGEAGPSTLWPILAMYMAGSIVFVARMFIRFRRPTA